MKTERMDALSRARRIEQMPIVIVKNIAIPKRTLERPSRSPNRVTASIFRLTPGDGFTLASDLIPTMRSSVRSVRRRHPERAFVVRDMRDGTALVARIR